MDDRRRSGDRDRHRPRVRHRRAVRHRRRARRRGRLAVLAVQLHRPELSITRWAHPSVLTVGDTGRVDLLIENRGSLRSPRVDLSEPVGTTNSAHMTIAPLRAGEQVTAGYRVPAGRRGVLQVGPALLERRDLLGLAVTCAARLPVPPTSRSRRGRSSCRCPPSDTGCSAGTCSRSRSASGPASSTACATTSPATNRARSTGRRRPAPRSSRCASTRRKAFDVASSCSTGTATPTRRPSATRRPTCSSGRSPSRAAS
jgi:hypothetical protein